MSVVHFSYPLAYCLCESKSGVELPEGILATTNGDLVTCAACVAAMAHVAHEFERHQLSRPEAA